jgi:ABC-2 type transport system ATP-binding protein
MNIVRGFLTGPQVLFLDEPTLGLDVGASRDVRGFVRRWVDEDTRRTLLLTTPYMVEAEEMCDRVAIINKGRVLSCGTPNELKRTLRAETLFRISVHNLNGLSVDTFQEVPGVSKVVLQPEDGVSHLEFILREDAVLGPVVNLLTTHNIPIVNLQKREPTLEDVFVTLVGRSMAEEEEGNAPASQP